jgi:excinuclease ABC subunit C
LIKKHQPVFNTKEKDDKSYLCVVITKEDFPRVLIMRTRDYEKRFIKDGSLEKIDKVYGPFTNGNQIKDAVKIIRRIFPYRDRCEVGTDILKDKPCFNAQIKLCPGVCCGCITSAEYKNNIKHIKDLFEGKRETIKKDLEKEMKQAAKEERFERAGVIRNTIWALDHIRDVSLIKDDNSDDMSAENNDELKSKLKINKNSNFRIEAFDVAHISGTNRVGVMTVVIDGKKDVSEYKKFKLMENVNDDYMGIVEMLRRRLKHSEWSMPDLIVIDGGVGQKNIAEKVISQMSMNIRVVSVVKDDKHKARDILGIESILGEKIDVKKKESKSVNQKLKESIILANHEAHRFAIKYHKELRGKI